MQCGKQHQKTLFPVVVFHTRTAQCGEQGEGMVILGLTEPVLQCSIVILGRIGGVILRRYYSPVPLVQVKCSIIHFDKWDREFKGPCSVSVTLWFSPAPNFVTKKYSVSQQKNVFFSFNITAPKQKEPVNHQLAIVDSFCFGLIFLDLQSSCAKISMTGWLFKCCWMEQEETLVH